MKTEPRQPGGPQPSRRPRPARRAAALSCALAATVAGMLMLASAAWAELPVAQQAVLRSECGPTGCPSRTPSPWQHATGFALAVGAVAWAAPRRPLQP